MDNRYDNWYFKYQSPEENLISGRPLPKDDDGIVRNIEFVNCEFHPNCEPSHFENCTFTNCYGPHEPLNLWTRR